MPPPHSPRKKAAAWRRWAGVTLRSVHLAAVSWLAVALYGAPAQQHTAGLLLLASGSALLAIELADRRVRLDELAGAIVLVKLAMAGAMVVWPGQALWMFWTLLLVSSASSHMPRDWRHWPTKS
jgi:Gpi18-like mannosyltransferase